MKKLAFMLLWGISMTAQSESVVIANVESPEFTEVQSQKDQSWHVLADLAKFSAPLKARWVAGSRTDLVIRIGNEDFVIARADVELANEQIVTSACDTVPLSIANNSTSVSVKGAGESCN